MAELMSRAVLVEAARARGTDANPGHVEFLVRWNRFDPVPQLVGRVRVYTTRHLEQLVRYCHERIRRPRRPVPPAPAAPAPRSTKSA